VINSFVFHCARTSQPSAKHWRAFNQNYDHHYRRQVLIGGSIGLELKTKRFADRIIGVDLNPVHRDIALERGLGG
jgi:hypothetical protein